MTKAQLGGEKIGPNPTDRGKGGVKRSLLTDGHGLPLALVIDGARRHDSMLLEATLARIVIDRPTNSSRSWLCLDLGYVGRRNMSMSGRSAWCLGFAAVGKNARRSEKERGRGAGSSNARIAGSIAIDAC